jgi:hypothetical protein
MGMIVLVRGVLRGMGQEVECDLIAMRRFVPSQSKFRRKPDHVYTDFGVIEAPDDLPDGQYTVSLGKQVLTTQKQRGLWLTCSECARK